MWEIENNISNCYFLEKEKNLKEELGVTEAYA